MTTKNASIDNAEMLNERAVELLKKIADLEQKMNDLGSSDFKFKYVNPYIADPPRPDSDVAQEGPSTPTGATAVWLSYGG